MFLIPKVPLPRLDPNLSTAVLLCLPELYLPTRAPHAHQVVCWAPSLPLSTAATVPSQSPDFSAMQALASNKSQNTFLHPLATSVRRLPDPSFRPRLMMLDPHLQLELHQTPPFPTRMFAGIPCRRNLAMPSKRHSPMNPALNWPSTEYAGCLLSLPPP